MALAATLAAGALSAGPQAGAQATGIYDAAMRAAITGTVRDRGGRPQVGVLVELLNTRFDVVARTFTDDRGRYTLPRLGAGHYQIQARSELLLPALRPNLRLLANARIVVNLTLASINTALDWLPAEPRQPGTPSDDWDWTLRLATNRPLLRMLPGASAPVLMEEPRKAGIRARELAGVRRFGEGGFSQEVRWSAADEIGHAIALAAEAGRGRVGCTVGYRQELTPGRALTTTASYALRPSIRGAAGAGLETARVRSDTTVRAGDLFELTAGTELLAARLGGAPLAAEGHPFATLRTQAGAVTVEYRVATAANGEDAPGLVSEGGRLRFEHGLHQELRATRKAGSWTGEIAAFEDRLEHPMVQGALRGGDEAEVDSKDVLLDPETGIIAVSGRGYAHGGVLALLRDQLSPDTWLSLRFALGEAVTAPAGASAFRSRTAPAATVEAGTRLPASDTAVRGSYRWQPLSTLTAVAPFAEARPDAYLGLEVRQPLHLRRVGAAKLEAVLDVRNLLAQGYRPFLSEDGATVFFAQAQRTIAGGISFSF